MINGMMHHDEISGSVAASAQRADMNQPGAKPQDMGITDREAPAGRNELFAMGHRSIIVALSELLKLGLTQS